LTNSDRKRPILDQRKGKDVYLQGSRQMDSLSRQYYERSLGAGMFVSPETENGIVGYSEPLRRFVQHEGFAPQVNEIAKPDALLDPWRRSPHQLPEG
jgi:hypothetical protein